MVAGGGGDAGRVPGGVVGVAGFGVGTAVRVAGGAVRDGAVSGVVLGAWDEMADS